MSELSKRERDAFFRDYLGVIGDQAFVERRDGGFIVAISPGSQVEYRSEDRTRKRRMCSAELSDRMAGLEARCREVDAFGL